MNGSVFAIQNLSAGCRQTGLLASASSICPREWEGRILGTLEESEATFLSELELAIRESYFATNCPPLTQPSGCSHVGKNNNALAAALTGVLVCVCVCDGRSIRKTASDALINMLLCAENARGPRIDPWLPPLSIVHASKCCRTGIHN